MKDSWLEELHEQAIKEYNSYLDLVWDIYYTKTIGILPVRQ